jgi:hypothetical protein
VDESTACILACACDVQECKQLYLADGVVATGEVVCGILLARDQLLCSHRPIRFSHVTCHRFSVSHEPQSARRPAKLLTWVEQLAVCAGANLINDRGLQIACRHMSVAGRNCTMIDLLLQAAERKQCP